MVLIERSTAERDSVFFLIVFYVQKSKNRKRRVDPNTAFLGIFVVSPSG